MATGHRRTHLTAALVGALWVVIAVLVGAPAGAVPTPGAAPTGSGPDVWKRYDVTIDRGAWQTLATHTIPAGDTWTVSLQLTLDLDSATGSPIRGRNTSIGWARLGWGGQSVNGSADLTGATDNAIAERNDTRYQHLAQHTLAGGGPLAWRVKVGGTGTVTATLLVFKAIRGAPSAGCPPLLPACLAADIAGGIAGLVSGGVGGMVESAAESMLGVVARGVLEAYLIVFRYATTWWLNIDMSPTALVGAIDPGFRATIAYIASFILVLSLLSAAIQTMWRRDGTVVGDAATGLFKAVLVIFGAWGVLGVLWALSDQLTDALAPSAANIDVDPVLALGTLAAGPGLAILVILISLVGFVVSLGVALMMVFRVASAVILALLLPIAAAGAPGTSTRGWLPKVTGWLLALIFVRPMVAAIFRIGFEFLAGGNDPDNAALVAQMGKSSDPDTVPAAASAGLMTLLVGVMTLLVAVFALPVLLKLFSWVFGAGAVGMGGGGLALASLGMQGAMLRGRSQGAAQHANRAGRGPGQPERRRWWRRADRGWCTPDRLRRGSSGRRGAGSRQRGEQRSRWRGGGSRQRGGQRSRRRGRSRGGGRRSGCRGRSGRRPGGDGRRGDHRRRGHATGREGAGSRAASRADRGGGHHMSTTSPTRVRTYGGWRERKGFGIAGMDGRGTAIAVGAGVVVLAVGMFTSTGLLLIAPVLAVVLAGTVLRWRGEPAAVLVRRHLAFRRAVRRGWTTHTAGAGRPDHAQWTLPGPLAGTMLVESLDDRARTWAAVWDRRTGTLTAVLNVAPTSTWLVDPDQVDEWVGSWHSWLAKLGYAPLVTHVAVTVETTPAPPSALAAVVRPQMVPDAPPASRALVDELLATSPTTAAKVATRVAITIAPTRAATPLGGLPEQLAEFSRALDGFTRSLTGCGVAVLGRSTVTDLVTAVRGAFDPGARDALTATPAGLTWADARPQAAIESWDTYQSDSGHSVSWGWDEAPRQAVTATVLSNLIAPGPFAKRVTMLYTPTPAAAAARELELQSQAAVFRSQLKSKTGRDETARDAADRARAMQAAAEEASGAGLVTMSLYVTVTVTDPTALPRAAADTEARAEECRIRLRRLYGGQAVGFAAGLSAGINPAALQGR